MLIKSCLFVLSTVFALSGHAQNSDEMIGLKIEQYYTNIDRRPDSLASLNTALIQSRLGATDLFIDFMQIEMNDQEIFAATIIKNKGVPEVIEIPKITTVTATVKTDTTTGKERGGAVMNEGQGAALNYKVYENLLSYLEPHFIGSKTIYYSTSDALNFINLKHLKDKGGKYLFEKYHMVRLHTAASFLGGRQNLILSKKLNALLVGNVVYTCPDQKGGKSEDHLQDWEYLPGSKIEVDSIYKLLKPAHQVHLLDSCAATESNFVSTISGKKYDILHLATHGFYFKKENPRFGITRAAYPLLLAGIVLSGANNVAAKVDPFNENGMFTALDFKNVNISNINLVVLSTCYSGEGSNLQSSAPLGLMVALLRHGITAMLVSNQAIPDNETTQFMVTFYRHLSKNSNADQSFTSTLRELILKRPDVDWSFLDLIH